MSRSTRSAVRRRARRRAVATRVLLAVLAPLLLLQLYQGSGRGSTAGRTCPAGWCRSQIIVSGSTHTSLVADREHAVAVVDAVRMAITRANGIQ